MAEQVSVSRTIAAEPDQVWALVSDLPRMGEWSPEATGGRWLGATSRPKRGARFIGHNRAGWLRWSTIATVVTYDEPSEFVFDVSAGPVKVSRWTYRIEPDDDGCMVTETWEDHRSKLIASTTSAMMRIKDRASHNRETMEKTLDSMAVALENAAA
ncbi:MAG: SRPBCC family protein [Microthrixaceae bacterium]